MAKKLAFTIFFGSRRSFPCALTSVESQPTGVPVRAINRPGSQLLGANGRDDGPIVSINYMHFCFCLLESELLCVYLGVCTSTLVYIYLQVLCRHAEI